VAGYRVKEVLLGQNNIAVGRTSHIKGDLTIKGTTVTAAAFTVCDGHHPQRPEPARRPPEPRALEFLIDFSHS